MKNKQGQEWLRSVVTLKDSYSYGVAGQTFKRGVPAKVNKVKVREALKGLSGFHIVDVWEPLTPVEKAEVKSEEKSKPKSLLDGGTAVRAPKTIKIKQVKKSEEPDEDGNEDE